eukprot:4320289-Pyramimonas_sp.AAC.1
MPRCTGSMPCMPPVFFGLALFMSLAAPFALIAAADLSTACARRRGTCRAAAPRAARMFIHRATVSQ